MFPEIIIAIAALCATSVDIGQVQECQVQLVRCVLLKRGSETLSNPSVQGKDLVDCLVEVRRK